MTSTTGLDRIVEAALAETDSEAGERLYRDVVRAVRRLHGENENVVAAELQKIASKLESAGRKKQAFDFKQKSCTALLELSMEEPFGEEVSEWEKDKDQQEGGAGEPLFTISALALAPSEDNKNPMAAILEQCRPAGGGSSLTTDSGSRLELRAAPRAGAGNALIVIVST